MNQRLIRVLCVDDHAFLVDGLRARFEMEKDLGFVGWLPSADDLLREVRSTEPDVVLIDIEMPGAEPFESVSMLRRMFPDTQVIFLSAHVRDHYISCAMDAGALGYFSKADDPESIIDGIRTVARRGRFVFGPKVKDRLKPAPRTNGANGSAPVMTALQTLSPREQEVLRLIGRGMTRCQIADTLCRSPKTVDGHREKIMEKLDIHDRGELVRYAIREGLVEV